MQEIYGLTKNYCELAETITEPPLLKIILYQFRPDPAVYI